MDENKSIELTKEQLDEVAGGGGKKGYETVSCPYCGEEKEVSYKPGKTVTCSACGKQFEI
ncbi:MAG: hypothetical protein II885_17465 [Oscillospiraceae bacterium]|nr:hypothetical protein [Oscillospiraceae bacterium]